MRSGAFHIRHAMLLWVLLRFYTYDMLRHFPFSHMRHATLLCVFPHASCSANGCPLALSHIRHAMLLCVLLHFHACVMLCYCAFFCTSAHTSCYPIVRSGALPCICQATVLFLAFTKCVQLIQFQNVPDWSKSEAVPHTQTHQDWQTKFSNAPEVIVCWCGAKHPHRQRCQ